MAGNDWMSQLDDRRSITELAIPGTHDTGAYNPGDWSELTRPMTFAQSLDIPGQLNVGVRALDLRCGSNYYGKSFSLYHGPYQLPDYIPDVITSVVTFLNANPSEFVILMLKIEPPGSSDWSVKLNDIINDGLGNKLERRLNRETRWPTVGEMRGKVLVLSRFPQPHQYHFDTRAWGGNVQDQTIQVTSAIYNHPQRLNVRLQDLYNKPTFQNKLQAVQALMRAAKTSALRRSTDTLFLNFASYVVMWAQPRDIGRNQMNPRLRAMATKCGVVCVDDADAATISSIYNDNTFAMPVQRRRSVSF